MLLTIKKKPKLQNKILNHKKTNKIKGNKRKEEEQYLKQKSSWRLILIVPVSQSKIRKTNGLVRFN